MDINYNEVFGIEDAQPAPTEAEAATKEPDRSPAERVRDGEDGSPESTSIAARGDATNSGEQGREGTQEAQEAAKEPKPPQSAEENARQAAGRRIREREAAARDAARAEVSETLRRLGITDPSTGEPVDTVDKLEAYEKGLSEARLAKGKGTADDVRRVVREEMAGQPARPVEQKQPAPAPTEADFAAEIAEIQRMDPSVKDLRSIVESEVGPKFREYVGKGLNFVDAYTLAARSKLAAAQAQAAQVKAAGKDHLSATQSRGSEADIPVPADELELFRTMMPEMSDTEFRKYWNKNRRK